MSVFKRFSNLIRGFFGLFLGSLEKASPEALLEVERENLRAQIAKYNQGLASHAGLCERLMGQVRAQEGQEKDLKKQISGHLRGGNKEAAAPLALRYQTVSGELENSRQQLEAAEQTYKDMIKARDVSIAAVKDKIATLTRGVSDMKLRQAGAELAETASGLVHELGTGGDTLSRLEQMVEEERMQAAGRARLAKDTLGVPGAAAPAAATDADAEAALADFAAQEGLPLDLPAATAPVAETSGADGVPRSGKSMGPGRPA